MKIYTRTGDKGQTSLVSGQRISKASVRVETYGTVDELNSMLGVVTANFRGYGKGVKRELMKIQHDLFTLGAYLASKDANPQFSILNFQKRVEEFEKQIDHMTKTLTPLKNFILPGGGKAGAMLHLARTVCRRAERRLIALSEKEPVDLLAIKYLNRLSDLLFTMARFVNMREKKREIMWRRE